MPAIIPDKSLELFHASTLTATKHLRLFTEIDETKEDNEITADDITEATAPGYEPFPLANDDDESEWSEPEATNQVSESSTNEIIFTKEGNDNGETMLGWYITNEDEELLSFQRFENPLPLQEDGEQVKIVLRSFLEPGEENCQQDEEEEPEDEPEEPEPEP